MVHGNAETKNVENIFGHIWHTHYYSINKEKKNVKKNRISRKRP